jgi:putative oxygen-independent coproporphyrinogen III oxidase
MGFGIYIHMPFCRRRCPYCDFYKKVPRAGEMEVFPSVLERELEARAATRPFSDLEVTSIYFGGGTPSLHPPEHIRQILKAIHRHWPVKAEAEITLEANPATVSPHELGELLRCGVNRLSLGLQSFSQRKLQVLFRDHNASDSRESFHQARQAGFSNVSVDLIFGLPDETLNEWLADLEQVLRLGPDHISLYNLEYHEGTPFYRWRESGRLVPLSGETELEMYLAAHEKLAASGFEHYEISNFARAGFRAEHNLLYWTGSPYLGVGPSAHSYDGSRTRLENPPDFLSWRTSLTSESAPATSRERMTIAQRNLEWLSMRLRLAEGISYDETVRRVGVARADAMWQLAQETAPGLIDVGEAHVALTPRGWFCENEVILRLYKGLNGDPAPEHQSGGNRSNIEGV